VRTKSLRAVLAAVVFAGSAGVIGYFSLGTASADVVPETLPAAARHVIPHVQFLGDVVVDASRRRVAVADQYGNHLLVLNYDGSTVTDLTGLAGVDGLRYSADYTRLYAAVPGAHAIVAYDAASLAEVARYPLGKDILGDDIAPDRLAFAGGKLWFSYTRRNPEDPSGHLGTLGSLDLADGTVANELMTPITGRPMLASTPAAPRLLAVAPYNESSARVQVFDVSDGTAVELVHPLFDLSNLLGIALSADGTRVAAGGTGGTQLASIDGSGTSALVSNPGAVKSVAASEAGLAVGSMATQYGPELHLFLPGATTIAKQWDIPNTNFSWTTNRVAWEPGGGRLFAFTDEPDGTQSMWTIDDPAHTPTQLTVSAPTTADRGAAIFVKASLTGGLPNGTKLAVTRVDAESPSGVALPAVSINVNGDVTFVDYPPAGGNVKYLIAYAGDGIHKPSNGSATVAVTKTTPALTLTPAGTVYNYGATVTFTAHLGSAFSNRTVEIWADPAGADQANRLLRKVPADAQGNVTTALKLTRNTTLSAVYAGDTRYAARTVKSTVSTRVSVTTAVTKQYTTGGAYYYFHRTINPVFTTTMTAAPNRRQKLYFEVYSGGSWKPWKSYLLPLSSAGKSAYTLTGTHTINVNYRVRAAYLTTTSGDSLNYTTYGPYRYFAFRR